MRRSGRLHATQAGVAALAMTVAGCTSSGSRAKQMPEGGGVVASGGSESTPGQVAAAQGTESGGELISPPSAATAEPDEAHPANRLPVTITTSVDNALVSALAEKYGLRLTPVNPQDAEQAIATVERALRCYPRALVTDNINTVLIARSITSVEGVEAGGTYDLPSRCIIVKAGYSSADAERGISASVHHELSSFVLLQHRSQFPEAAWTDQNPRGFRYAYEPGKGGSEAVVAGMGDRTITVELLRQSFLNRYSQSSLEDDFNQVVEAVMISPEWYQVAVLKYPELGKKMVLAMQFYKDCYPEFVPPIPLSEQPRPAPEPRVQEPRR